MKDPYYNRPEVSNSDLSEIKKYWMPQGMVIDYEQAYKFGSLIDAMLTEEHRVDYYKYRVGEVEYTKADFDKAKEMKAAFLRDPLCVNMLKMASTQSVMSKNRKFIYQGVEFELPVRCKWDIWMEHPHWGGDIKSTTATSQKQFEEAVRYFDYDRQRAWYMDIAGSDQDILIGISKVNFKIFKVPIKRGDELYKSGLEKYLELAFKHWYLFGELTYAAA
jgi:hypothetical protein